MKREREREIISDSSLSFSLSPISNLIEPQYLLSLCCYACWLKCKHIQPNNIESLSIRNKVLNLQRCYWKFKKWFQWEKLTHFMQTNGGGCCQHLLASVSFWLCWSLIAISSLDMSAPHGIKCFSLSHKVSHFHVKCRPVPTGSPELSMIPTQTATDGTEQPSHMKQDKQNKRVIQ